MPFLRVILFAMLGVILTGRSPLPAAPHEPSPAGGGWLDFHSELSVVQSEGPWFPAFPGPLTLEAWLYVDEPPDIRNAFSIVGQTDRFNWAILRSSRGNVDAIPAAIGGIFTPETGMVTAQLPARQWVHYVATIDGGAAVGGGGFLTNLGSGGPNPKSLFWHSRVCFSQTWVQAGPWHLSEIPLFSEVFRFYLKVRCRRR